MAPNRRWLVWSGFVVLWTTGLLLPAQAFENLPGQETIASKKFPIGKSLHVAGYAVMTILSAWLHLAPRYRWILVFFLMGHATATELIQQGVEGRTGSLRDVALDHLGVMLGLLLTWKWWLEEDGRG